MLNRKLIARLVTRIVELKILTAKSCNEEKSLDRAVNPGLLSAC